MVAEIPIVFVARALAAARLHGIPGQRHSRRKENVCVPSPNGAAPRDRIHECRPGGGGYRAELFIHRGNLARPRADKNFFFSTPEILRARAAASSFSTFLIVICNWMRARGGNFPRSIINRARGAKYPRTSCVPTYPLPFPSLSFPFTVSPPLDELFPIFH